MIEPDIFSATDPDPYNFFATAAGPDAADLYGPPGNVLDVYGDGTPVSMSESMIANSPGAGGAGGAGVIGFLNRPDVRAFIVLGIGLVLLHRHMEA